MRGPSSRERPQADGRISADLEHPQGVEPCPPRWKRGVAAEYTSDAWWSVRRGMIPVLHLGKVPCCRVHLGREWRSAKESNPLLPGWSRGGRHDLPCVSR